MEGTVVVFASTSQATIFLARVSAELLEIFGALLGIAQIEGGGTRRRFARLNLKDLPLEIVDTYANVAEDAGQHLAMDPGPPVEIVGDRSLLIQAFVNLVENAIRHTQVGAGLRLALVTAGSRPQWHCRNRRRRAGRTGRRPAAIGAAGSRRAGRGCRAERKAVPIRRVGL